MCLGDIHYSVHEYMLSLSGSYAPDIMQACSVILKRFNLMLRVHTLSVYTYFKRMVNVSIYFVNRTNNDYRL